MIDLRSDTITTPCSKMREAIYTAPVGDDVFGEDPTINKLEAFAADLFGKESALFVPSGTMANAISIMVYCRPGDEVLLGANCHPYLYEAGGGAALAGVQMREVGTRGIYTPREFVAALRPEDIHYAPTGLVMVENTHNVSGGIVFPFDYLQEIRQITLDHKLPLHMDGARVFNAISASGKTTREMGSVVDSLSICLSKGLAAPVGSVLVGSKKFIHKARRYRKMLGGGMRQAGFLAAAGLYALNNNISRLAEDHRLARILAKTLARCKAVSLDPNTVETNIVMVYLKNSLNAFSVAEQAKEKGVLVLALGAEKLRMVTHKDISETHIRQALKILTGLLSD